MSGARDTGLGNSGLGSPESGIRNLIFVTPRFDIGILRALKVAE